MLRKDGMIAVATLLRPQGRRGEILSDPLTNLHDVFATGQHVTLSASGELRTIEEAWWPTGRNAGRLVLKLSGCESIEDAEKLSGVEVSVPASSLPVLDDDTFFAGDLVGCAFFDGEEAVGKIVDLEFPVGADGRRLEDAAPLLVVETGEGAEPMLVPFVKVWLEGVDLEAKRVTMRLPVGLLQRDADETESGDAV